VNDHARARVQRAASKRKATAEAGSTGAGPAEWVKSKNCKAKQGTPSRRVVRAHVIELRALDRLVDATQRLADLEALSRFLNNFPNEGFHSAPTITRESALAEIKARGIG
jgi:hypothetical protein